MNHIKILLIFCFAFCAFDGFTQNWQPVNKNFRYNYRNSNTATVFKMPAIFTIRTVKDSISGSDSVFVFNPIAVPTDSFVGDSLKPVGVIVKQAYILNGASFLLRNMRIINSGIYLFSHDSNEFAININPSVKSWIFDSIHHITATWMSLKDSMILGSNDSIRIASLSTGTHIILSKNNGIIQFPAFYNQKTESPFFKLSGIDEKKAGDVLPDGRNINDLAVGDSFEYETLNSQYGDIAVRDQYVITSKTGNYGSYNYQISGKQITIHYDAKTTYSSTNSPSSHFIYGGGNNMPVDFSLMEEGYPIERFSFLGPQNMSKVAAWIPADTIANSRRVGAISITYDSLTHRYRKTFMPINQTGSYLPWFDRLNVVKPGSSVVTPLYFLPEYSNQFRTDCEPGIGLIDNYVFISGDGSGTDMSNEVHLIAYKSNNGTRFGQFTGIENAGAPAKAIFGIYPNPVNDVFRIFSSQKLEYTWKLSDVHGNILSVGKSNNELTTVDMATLSTGLYILTINSGADMEIVKIAKL